MPTAADGKQRRDVCLAVQAAVKGDSRPKVLSQPLSGDRGPLGLSLQTNLPRIVSTTLSCPAGNEKISACGCILLTEMSDA